MTISALPSYEVEFIPLERRLADRRVNSKAGLPPDVTADRRKTLERRQVMLLSESSVPSDWPVK